MKMMGIGITTALIWNLGFNLSSAIYEVLPGMAAGMAVYGFVQLFGNPKLSRSFLNGGKGKGIK